MNRQAQIEKFEKKLRAELARLLSQRDALQESVAEAQAKIDWIHSYFRWSRGVGEHCGAVKPDENEIVHVPAPYPRYPGW